MVLLWVLKWLLLLLTFFLVCSKPRETNALTNAPWQLHTWWRYINDIFMIWTEGSHRLKIFVDYLHNIHPTTKFTSSHSLTNVPFLDVMVSQHNGIIETDLFTKPVDRLGKLPSKEQQLSRTQHFILRAHAAIFIQYNTAHEEHR